MTLTSREQVSASRGYAAWASSYEAENAVTTLDQLITNQLTPSLDGLRLLDAGCGTGRRLRDTRSGRPAYAVGVDIVYQMLRAGVWTTRDPHRPVNADVAALPFRPCSFDGVWCRLALGHVADLKTAYRELSRVLNDGGTLVATDFHPAAAAAGHARTFKDASDATQRLAFFSHSLESHTDAAADAGLQLVKRCEVGVGPAVRAYYETAGRLARYESDLGLPLVFGLAFCRQTAIR